MLTMKEVEELKHNWEAEGTGDCHWYDDAETMIDTIEAALRVVEAAEHLYFARLPKCDCSVDYGGKCFSCELRDSLNPFTQARVREGI